MRPTRNRLLVREGTTPLPTLREGVPRSLESALRGWIWETASLDSEVAQHVLIRLDLVLPVAYWQRYQKELRETGGRADRTGRPLGAGALARLHPCVQASEPPLTGLAGCAAAF